MVNFCACVGCSGRGNSRGRSRIFKRGVFICGSCYSMQFLPFFLKLTGLRSLLHKQHFTKDAAAAMIKCMWTLMRFIVTTAVITLPLNKWWSISTHRNLGALRIKRSTGVDQTLLSPIPKKKERIGSGYTRLVVLITKPLTWELKKTSGEKRS